MSQGHTFRSDEKMPIDDVETADTKGYSGGKATALEEDAIVDRFGPARSLFAKMFAAGVEARGIERVPETERSDRNSANSLFLWFSVNTVLTTCM